MATLNQGVIATTSKEKMRELAKFIAAYNEFRGQPSAEIKRQVKAKYDGLLTEDKYNQLLIQAARLTNERTIPTLEEWELAKTTFVEIGNEKIANAKTKLRDAIRKRNRIVLDENGKSIPINALPKKLEDSQRRVRNTSIARVLLSAGLGLTAAIAVIALAPTSIITLPVLLGSLGGAALGGWAGAALGKVFVNNATASRDKIESLFESHREELEEIEREIQQAEELVGDLEDQYDATIISSSERSDMEAAEREAAEREAEREAEERRTEEERVAREREESERRAEEERMAREREERESAERAEREATERVLTAEAAGDLEAPKMVEKPAKSMTTDEILSIEEPSKTTLVEKPAKNMTTDELLGDINADKKPKVEKVSKEDLKKAEKEVNPKKDELKTKAKEAEAIEKTKQLCYNGIILGATTKIDGASTEKQNAEEKVAKLAKLESRIESISSEEEGKALLQEIKSTVSDIKVSGYRVASEKDASKLELPKDAKEREKLRDRTTEKYLTERRKTHVEKKDGLVNLNRVEEVENNPDLKITGENYNHAASELQKILDVHATLSAIKSKGGFKQRNAGEHDIEKVIAANATRLAKNVAEFETETEIEDNTRIEELLKESGETLTSAQKELLKKHKQRTLQNEDEMKEYNS